MPVTKRRLKNGKVRVSTPGGVKAKATTPAKAAAQERLLNAVEHGWKPTGKKAKHHSANDGSFLAALKKKFGVD